MQNNPSNTPILFLIFNRPDLTSEVFKVIRNHQPQKLFIAADGPRPDIQGEARKCEETRNIISQIDWNCQTKTLFREKNLGCKNAVSSAIKWFFDHVEEGIILEDDCLPDPSFFGFCHELLEHYRHDERIMMISGDNFQRGRIRGDGSYYFSKYCHIWGWATWRRAWKHYDINMASYPSFLSTNQITNVFENSDEQRFWLECIDKIYKGEIDTWDMQWAYAIFKNSGLSIIPNANLVKNIGFDERATHTRPSNCPDQVNELQSIDIGKIAHPTFILVQKEAELYMLREIYKVKPKKKKKKLKKKIKNLFKETLKTDKRQEPRRVLSKNEQRRISKIPRYEEGTAIFDGRKIKFVDSASFLSGVEEIFEKNNYFFKSEKQKPLIIDCGSNIGLSVFYFKKLYPYSKIIAFEPDPNIFKVLTDNIHLLGIEGVQLMQKAVWTERKKIKFLKEGGFSGRIQKKGDDINIIDVDAIRLRNYLNKKIDFLKLDVEGAETNVIIDCADRLKNVSSIFIEYHSHITEKQSLGRILNILTTAGFRYQIKDSFASRHPFINFSTMEQMDFQADIFAVKY